MHFSGGRTHKHHPDTVHLFSARTLMVRKRWRDNQMKNNYCWRLPHSEPSNSFCCCCRKFHAC